MITKEQIQDQIDKLKTEGTALQAMHQDMVSEFQKTQAEFQQKVAINQNRFQQITGAISELTSLLQFIDPQPEPPPA
jgi:uncharacterized protein YukE